MTPGPQSVLRAAKYGTIAFVAGSIAAVAYPQVFGRLVAAVDVVLFSIGCVLFFVAYARAIARSRSEAIGIGGLYFLAGDSATPEVRRVLVGCLVVQVVVALAAAFARPYSVLAAGVLVPVFGLGLCGYWASRYGMFPSRDAPPRPGG